MRVNYMEEKNSKNELIRLTLDLIKFKTTGNNSEEIKKCLQYIKEYFNNCGLIIKEFLNNGKRSLYISCSDSKKSNLLLNGHIDVVPAEDEQYMPFVENNHIYGRGAVDMKAGVASYMLLFRELAEQGVKHDMALMIVSDEETGGDDGTRHLIEDLGYSSDFAMASEPGHSSPDRVNITIAEKGLLWLKIKTRGVSCHGSRPWLGENAIEKMMQKTMEIKKLFPETTESDRWKTTVNIAAIKGGDTANKVPDLAELTLDIRYTEETSIPEIIDKFNRIRDIEVEVLHKASMMVNHDDADPVNRLQNIGKKISGKEVELTRDHGASDLRFTSEKNIPSVIFGPYGRNHHGKGEYVSIKSLDLYYKILKTFITQYYTG